jgi:murein DD-endopeptidase MepM/ murein hydrolase activator NlpD
MHSINVRVGQLVSKGNILGYEGSTGASTGAHLHFEIRLNGEIVDPRKYVTGMP